MAQSGHRDRAEECLLSGVKRTSQFGGVMSAIDPNGHERPKGRDAFEAHLRLQGTGEAGCLRARRL